MAKAKAGEELQLRELVWTPLIFVYSGYRIYVHITIVRVTHRLQLL